jgi:hypothetical protein
LTLPPTLRDGAAAEAQEADLLPPLVTLEEEEEEEEEDEAFCVTVVGRGGGRGHVLMRKRMAEGWRKWRACKCMHLQHGRDVPFAARPSARVE